MAGSDGDCCDAGGIRASCYCSGQALEGPGTDATDRICLAMPFETAGQTVHGI